MQEENKPTNASEVRGVLMKMQLMVGEGDRKIER
jgi:hypothetical protein